MSVIMYLIIVILIITLCFKNVSTFVFKTVRWLILIVVITTTLLILNDALSQVWMISFAEKLESSNIGNPMKWLNGSFIYREYMLGIYYLSIIGSMAMFSINLMHKDKVDEQIKEMPIWKNILSMMILFLMLYLFLYIYGSRTQILSVNELEWHIPSHFSLNIVIGIVFLEYLIIVLSGYCAKYVKWLVCSLGHKINPSICKQ